MGFSDDLRTQVETIFSSLWETRDGRIVPEDSDIQLGNDAVKLDATVLYADMDGSTSLVDNRSQEFSAEIYKSFLLCAAKIIKNEGGVITAYDGDRIMAVFIGDSKNTSAARTALGINWAVTNLINPENERAYGTRAYKLNHVVGIDTSSLFVARTGVRGANDLVWVGRAANHAAKLTSLSNEYTSYITEDVYDKLNDSSKYSSSGENMWRQLIWKDMNRVVYGSTWWRSVT